METAIRMTMTTRAVLTALLPGRSWGMAIAAGTKMRTATVYEVLARLERAGLAASTWEVRGAPGELRDTGAPRRYWELTEAGRALAGKPYPP